MSLEVEKNAKPASKKRGYWGPFIENEPLIQLTPAVTKVSRLSVVYFKKTQFIKSIVLFVLWRRCLINC